MIISKCRTTIYCDESGCAAMFADEELDSNWTRPLAKKRGWTQRSCFDFCPTHSPTPTQQIGTP